MNILNKFDNIEINKECPIPETDMKFCCKCFELYSQIYKEYNNLLNTIMKFEQKIDFEYQERINDQKEMDYEYIYIFNSSGINSYEIKKRMTNLTKSFINNICSYFKRKYTSDLIPKELLAKSIDLQDYETEPKFCNLLEIFEKDIFDYLDGLSFMEKAIAIIKENSNIGRFYSEWDKEYNYDIKGKIIKFRFDINNIRPSLYLYDNNEKEIVNFYSHIKIDYEKKFKNGNVDIYFKKSEYAIEYARKYLGYNNNE